MSTVREAIDLLNDRHLHDAGYHATLVDQRLFPEDAANSDAPHRLMRQTYDWRYDFERPDKDSYTVEVSANDIRYIGHALEVYQRILFELYVEPSIKRILEKVCGTNEEAERTEANTGAESREG